MKGKWIWLSDGKNTENERGVFTEVFCAKADEEYALYICARTRYIVYLNGAEIGKGPIRGFADSLSYDTYDITPLLQEGENYLAARVWNYGWSTYQTTASEGGLFYEIRTGESTVAASGRQTRCIRDSGYKYNAVKRNVNLGFTDYYDAGKFNMDVLQDKKLMEKFERAEILEDEVKLSKRPIHSYHCVKKYPERVISLHEMKSGCQQVSVNTRYNFFPGRNDADESIFSGFLGCVLESPCEMDGKICFPNRTWNGLLGDFKIDNKLYCVTNQEREIKVRLKAGRQLFLMQISGKYDDLYSHIEFCFEREIIYRGLCGEDNKSFFTIGPTDIITQRLDGVSKVYGGLDEYNRLEEHTALHEEIFRCGSEAEIAAYQVKYIPAEYIFENEYILSLAKRAVEVKEEAITSRQLGILWDNLDSAIIPRPAEGRHQRLIVDFQELYVGELEFCVYAESGTVLDIYCYENMFREEIDYTAGLNNAVRYICKDGWQTYRCMARMGCRYAAIYIRNQKDRVKIQRFAMNYSTYAPSNRGTFRCNDYLLNKIWDISKQTHLLCMEDSFTDCPTWEQSFWIGDAQISARVNAYLFGEYDYIRHNLKLAAGALRNTPLMNALTPTDWNTSIPMWAMNFIVSVRQYMEVTGDKSILEELYADIKTTLLYYGKLIRADGAFLINAWNMLDWADMDIHNYGVVTGQQALLAYCYEIAAGFADMIHQPQDADIYRKYCRNLRNYIDQKLWDTSRRMFMDGYSPDFGFSKTVSIQTHILLMLFGGIQDLQKEEYIKKYLRQPPKEFIQVGSPFMLFYLYEVWMKEGRAQEVLDDMKERFGGMLFYDSTTCWEVFPGFYENSRTRSYCHGWSAAPVYFLNRYLLGVDMQEEGFQSIEIKIPDTRLEWCRGSIPTPYGDIRVDMERITEVWNYRIKLPKEIRIKNIETFPGRLFVTEY